MFSGNNNYHDRILGLGENHSGPLGLVSDAELQHTGSSVKAGSKQIVDKACNSPNTSSKTMG